MRVSIVRLPHAPASWSNGYLHRPWLRLHWCLSPFHFQSLSPFFFFSLFYIYFYLFLNVRTCKPEWWVHVCMWMNTPVLMCGTSEYVVCWWWLWMCVACVLGQVVGYGWRSSTYTLCTLSIMGFVYHGVVTARWISWSLSREQYSSYCPTTNMTCCINDKGNGHVE